MRTQQIEILTHVDQHVLTLEVAGKGAMWTNDAFGAERGIGVSPGSIAMVDFARDSGPLPVYLEVHDAAPPDDDLDDYQGVLEASLSVPGRKLVLASETETVDAVTLPAAPSDAWRVRVYFADSDVGRGDMSEGAEHARIVLFPGPMAPTTVLRPRKYDELVRDYQGKRTQAQLEAMAKSATLSHRCLAVVALTRLGALDAARAAATEGGAKLTWAGCAWMAGGAARDDLRRLAKDADPAVRGRVARSIALAEASELRDVVEALLEDPDARVRDDAGFAMTTLDPDYVLPAPTTPKPKLLFCTVAALGTRISKKARDKYGTRPMWFGRLLDEESHPASLFDRVKEPKANALVNEIMDALHALPRDHVFAKAAHAIVGDDESLAFGFHASATSEQAREAFTGDGYELVERGAPGIAWPDALSS